MDVKLVMFKSDGTRKDFPVTRPMSVIGRAEECDLRVPLLNVSRRHCEVHLGDDAVSVKDLGSSNGTYVNNKRVNQAELSAGDRLVIGPVVFTVQVDGEPAEIQPVKTRGQRMAERGEGGVEEVVDLDAEVSQAAASQPAEESAGPIELDMGDSEIPAQEGAAGQSEEQDEAVPLDLAQGSDEEEEDVDVIAALEALANEEDDKDDEEEEKA